MAGPAANSYVRYGTSNMVLPPEGPKCYPLQLDFRTVNEQVADFTMAIQQQHISFVQSIFIDNSLNMNQLRVITDQLYQNIIVQPETQGYFAVLVSDSAKLTFQTVVAGNLVVPIFVLNVPVTPYVWSVA